MSLNELNALIKRIPTMSDDELAEMLKHEHFIVRTSAIWETVNRHNLDKDVVSLLKDLKKDETKFWNFIKVQDFAFAALDILGVEKYAGDNEYVKRLIKDEMKI